MPADGITGHCFVVQGGLGDQFACDVDQQFAVTKTGELQQNTCNKKTSPNSNNAPQKISAVPEFGFRYFLLYLSMPKGLQILLI